MRCLRCIVSFLIVVSIALIALAGVFVRYIGDWLATGGVPRSSDAIVVLAGAPERALYAADLYREGFARRVLLSRPAVDMRQTLYLRFGVQVPREEETSTRILTGSGVPLESIELFGTGSKSTVEEMETLRRRFGDQPLHLLVVSSPLHMRRAGMIARDVFQNSKLQVVMVATPYERVPTRWWTDQDIARGVLLEVSKTLFYSIGGRYRAQAHE